MDKTVSKTVPLDEDNWRDNYRFGQLIGEGHVGQVYRAVDVAGNVTTAQTGRDVVIKIYQREEKANQFRREVVVMKRVSGHPNVVRLLASHSGSIKGIVMPFYGEVDLHRHVWQCDGLSEIKTAGITRDLLSALQHIHSCEVIHRDVKPENMILDQDGKAILLDFDVACSVSDTFSKSKRCGSPGYLAPEVIQYMPCSFSSDVFSVGCVTYFMIAKVHPFVKSKDETVDDQLNHGIECKVSFGKRFKVVSRQCLKFILATIVRDPCQRLSAHQASAHPFTLQEENPRSRGSEPIINVPGANASMSAGSASSNAAPAREGQKTDALQAARSTGRQSSPSSRLSKVKRLGSNAVSKLSRAVGNMRRASKVAPMASIQEDPDEGDDCMTGVLIRD